MVRPQKDGYDITDGEKRDLIHLIQQGKSLQRSLNWGTTP
jgi:hypothetical protein